MKGAVRVAIDFQIKVYGLSTGATLTSVGQKDEFMPEMTDAETLAKFMKRHVPWLTVRNTVLLLKQHNPDWFE